MDDQLELPTNVVSKDQQDDDGESSGEEGMPDWTNIPGVRGISRAVIPKRGDKEFEPAEGGATALQSHVLTRSRNAMFAALKGTRATNSKTMSYAIWYPRIGRAHVVISRGTHFTSLGHSALREPPPNSDSNKPQKRLELMPEEALYLMERGSLFCWKEHDISFSLLEQMNSSDHEDCDLAHGAPMSVQQAFTEMIGIDDLSFHHYLVYAYLKRLGYTVSRAVAPPNTPFYPLAPPNNINSSSLISSIPPFVSFFARNITFRVSRLFKTFQLLAFGKHGTSFIGRLIGVLPRNFTTASIFKSLRTIRSGHDISLSAEPGSGGHPPQFQIFWNVWKPSTPWRKLDVPKPDFEIAVVDARKTPVPNIYQLSQLFASVEPRGPPPPRKRGPPNGKKAPEPKTSQVKQDTGRENKLSSLWARVCRAIGLPPTDAPAQSPNPFVHLKAGRKNVIVAAVDGSMINLVRFGEGDFSSWPMV